MPSPYLLDTTVLLHWTRNSPQAQAIDANYQLSSSAMRPLICEVSLGEMLAFSLSRNWGPQKLRRLAEIERQVVVVHISDSRVRQAYAELSTLAQSSGWSLFHGKRFVGWRCGARCRRTSLDDGHGLPSTPRKEWLADYGP
jgi:predicted nucleic acid-binding protein